jgi:hypothetical protein
LIGKSNGVAHKALIWEEESNSYLIIWLLAGLVKYPELLLNDANPGVHKTLPASLADFISHVSKGYPSHLHRFSIDDLII